MTSALAVLWQPRLPCSAQALCCPHPLSRPLSVGIFLRGSCFSLPSSYLLRRCVLALASVSALWTHHPCRLLGMAPLRPHGRQTWAQSLSPACPSLYRVCGSRFLLPHLATVTPRGFHRRKHPRVSDLPSPHSPRAITESQPCPVRASEPVC